MSSLFPLRPLQQHALDLLKVSILAGNARASTERKYYVYVLFRPSGEPFYVGMGSGRRWLKHEWRSHNSHVSSIIKQAGGDIPKVRVRVGLTLAEAKEAEISLIAAIGREKNGGPLVNLTDGGDGAFGFSFTPDQRAKMRESRKGKGYWKGKSLPLCAREKLREARLGSVASDEAKSKMSASQAGRKHSEETRAKMSASQSGENHAMYGRRHSKDSVEKIRTSCTGLHHSDETKRKMSEFWKGRDNPKLKLTNEQVEEIRRLKGHKSQKKLAEDFGVSQMTVSRVLRGETYAHP